MIEAIEKIIPKESSKFYKMPDKIIIPIFIRTMKETGVFHKFKTIAVLEACFKSRTTHNSESYLMNLSFWPKDCHLYKGNFGLLFFTRVFNLYFEAKNTSIGKSFGKLNNANSIIENIEDYARECDLYAYSKSQIQEILLFFDNMEKEIKEEGYSIYNERLKRAKIIFKNGIYISKSKTFVSPIQIGL